MLSESAAFLSLSGSFVGFMLKMSNGSKDFSTYSTPCANKDKKLNLLSGLFTDFTNLLRITQGLNSTNDSTTK